MWDQCEANGIQYTGYHPLPPLISGVVNVGSSDMFCCGNASHLPKHALKFTLQKQPVTQISVNLLVKSSLLLGKTAFFVANPPFFLGIKPTSKSPAHGPNFKVHQDIRLLIINPTKSYYISLDPMKFHQIPLNPISIPIQVDMNIIIPLISRRNPLISHE